MNQKKANIFAAIDTHDLNQAIDWAKKITPYFTGLKFGLEFFCHHGINGIQSVMKHADKDTQIFLDLKFHDIPNTVVKAIEGILPLEPDFITVHASGGADMISATAQKVRATKTKILVVTVLTSLSQQDLGIMSDRKLAETVHSLAQSACTAGAHGLVCSPHEVKSLREITSQDTVLMVPGIRPDGADHQDQKRVMTPDQAFDAGADFLVIGRPVTQANNPEIAARQICNSLQQNSQVA